MIENWLQRYIFLDIDKIFFATFPIKLHAWLSRLAKNETFSHSDKPAKWSPELIQRLKQTNNPISGAVDFWLNILLEGFITEFAVDTLKAYGEAERIFFKDFVVST